MYIQLSAKDIQEIFRIVLLWLYPRHLYFTLSR